MHDGKGGEHYKKHGEREVCEHMEDEAVDFFHYYTRVCRLSVEESIKKSLWAAMAVKHELRSGTKDNNSVDQEMAKAENYRHRQETDEWLRESK